jgi:hypothetical protein
MMTGSRPFMYTLVAVAVGAIAAACGGNDFRATIERVQSSAAQLSAAIQKGARATATKMATELKIEAATLSMEANSLGITL